MTVIKASCVTCGDVELAPSAVRLVVSSVAERSFYAFTCPACHDRVQKEATSEIVRLLAAGGIVAERVDVPAEVLEERPLTALTWDDVLDFATWIERAQDVAGVAGALAPRRQRT